MSQLDQAVQRIHELKVIPEVAIRLQRMSRDPRATASALERLIRTDPALSGRILKLANSPMFGLQREVTSLVRAIQLLGFETVCDLALALAFTARARHSSLVGLRVWEHAVRMAACARLLSRRVPGAGEDRSFTAALLADLGMLLLLELDPDGAEELMEEPPEERSVRERQLFGFDHAQLGAACLREWSLPEATCHSVERHHQVPDSHCMARPLHHVVVLSDVMATAAIRWGQEGVVDELAAHPVTLDLGLDAGCMQEALLELPDTVAWLLEAM